MKRNVLAGLLCLALFLVSMSASAGSSAYKSSAFGYGAGTTGGGNASPTLVSDASALQSALNSSNSAVIIITKDITVTNHISVTAKNKTLMALPGVKLISNQQNSSNSGILYFKKGSRIGVTGTIKTGSYEADGRKIPTFEVNVEEVEFGGKETAALKPKGETPEEPKQMSLDDLKPLDDIELPF